MIMFMIEQAPSSGVFGLDRAPAFPSLSRRYLHWLLKRMNGSRRIRPIIASQNSGVKQGHPSAMVLLCFAVIPLSGGALLYYAPLILTSLLIAMT